MKIDLNALTFGIEIETTMPGDALRAAGWHVGGYHVGAAIPGFPGWKAMHDGSIQAQYPRVGAEIVSPVLRGTDGLEQVERMVATLNAMGAAVNASTGFHVHIGWGGNATQLRRLVNFVAFHERALFASTGTTSRETNHFCHSIRANYRPLSERLATADDITAAALAANNNRYHVLNLANLAKAPSHRTVEFRVFAGTLNVVKILGYIALCLGIVQKALENSRQPLPWDAPVRPNVGVGTGAMRILLQHLHWRDKVRPGRTSAGVLDVAKLPAMKKQLLKMARQYDKRRAGGVA
jgi:hypothetical protein